MPDVEYCQFRTTVPIGAMSQAAKRGSPTRYRRCKNRAKHTVTVSRVTWAGTTYREIPCCGLHKRLYEMKGWAP